MADGGNMRDKKDWLVIKDIGMEFPEVLTAALNQARSNAGERQLGIIVLHPQGQRDAIVIMSLADFRDWLGNTEASLPIAA